MIKSWKTSLLGIVVIAGSLAQSALARDAQGQKAIQVLAGLGLIAAKDHDARDRDK